MQVRSWRRKFFKSSTDLLSTKTWQRYRTCTNNNLRSLSEYVSTWYSKDTWIKSETLNKSPLIDKGTHDHGQEHGPSSSECQSEAPFRFFRRWAAHITQNANISGENIYFYRCWEVRRVTPRDILHIPHGQLLTVWCWRHIWEQNTPTATNAMFHSVIK